MEPREDDAIHFTAFPRVSIKRNKDELTDGGEGIPLSSVEAAHERIKLRSTESEHLRSYPSEATPSLHLTTTTDEYALSQTDLDASDHSSHKAGETKKSVPGTVYENPFRSIDMSQFPLDLQKRLQELPIMTQVAILKNPALQQKYFPEYCYPT